MSDSSAAGRGVAPGRRVEHSGHPAPARANISLAALWFGVFGAPAAWSIQTLVNEPVAAHGCYPRLWPLMSATTGVRGITITVSVVAILICIAATAVSLRSWTRTREEHQPGTGAGQAHDPSTALMETGEGRTRFMALGGVLVSLTFLVLSIAHAAAIFIVAPCASW